MKFVNYQYGKISDSMDGKNIEAVLSELGVRLHRAIYDHLQGFLYSSSGVVSVMFDVQEYRKCVSLNEFSFHVVLEIQIPRKGCRKFLLFLSKTWYRMTIAQALCLYSGIILTNFLLCLLK